MAKEFDPSKYRVEPIQKRIEKPWGLEIIYTPDDAPAVGKIMHVRAGERISLQYHDEKIETLCLVKGEARVIISNKEGEQIESEMELNKGYYILPGQIHRVTAITDIHFIEASTPEKGITVRVDDDNKREDETEEVRALDNRGW